MSNNDKIVPKDISLCRQHFKNIKKIPTQNQSITENLAKRTSF